MRCPPADTVSAVRLLTPSDVDSLLAAHGLRASKALGQHFLADPNTARRIVRLAGVAPGDRVLEIGPGIGSLTLALAESGARVVAVERDRHVLPVLREVLADTSGVRVVEGDAVTLDYAQVLGSSGGGSPWRMVSNLPYNIATPLLVRMLEEAPQIGRFLVMIQREVGERLAAAPGERAAGAVSVKVAYHAEARVVGRVPPTVFVPRPNVESALVRLVRHDRPPVEVADPDAMFRLVRAGFGQRRKTLRRALRTALGDRTVAVLEAATIDPATRAERLTLDDWARLAAAAATPATP